MTIYTIKNIDFLISYHVKIIILIIKMYKIYIIIILISITNLCIGLWEANIIMFNYIPTDINNEIIYIFILCKSIFNIVFGLLFILLSIISMICNINTDILCSKTKYDILYLVNFGISIWGLIEYYLQKNIIKSFQQVLFVEMIIFYTYISIFLIIICMSCLLVQYIITNDTRNINMIV